MYIFKNIFIILSERSLNCLIKFFCCLTKTQIIKKKTWHFKRHQNPAAHVENLEAGTNSHKLLGTFLNFPNFRQTDRALVLDLARAGSIFFTGTINCFFFCSPPRREKSRTLMVSGLDAKTNKRVLEEAFDIFGLVISFCFIFLFFFCFCLFIFFQIFFSTLSILQETFQKLL